MNNQATEQQKGELLPCPFCGAKPHQGFSKAIEQVNSGDKYQNYIISCPKKCARIERETAYQAALQWNTRANSQSELEKLNQELVDRLTSVRETIWAHNKEVGTPNRFILEEFWINDLIERHANLNKEGE